MFNTPDIGFLLPFLRGKKSSIIFGAIGIIFVSILVIPGPMITKYIIDVIIPEKNTHLLILTISAVIVLLILSRIIDYWTTILFASLKARLALEIRLALLGKIHDFPQKELDKYSAGYLISRITDDTAGIQGLFVDTLIRLFSDFITFCTVSVAIFYLNWKLAVCTYLLLPIFVYLSYILSRAIQAKTTVYYEKNAISISRLEECLNLVPVATIFQQSKLNVSRFENKAKEAYLAIMDVAKTSNNYTAATGFVLGLIPSLVIGLGGYFIIGQEFTIGSLIAFFSFSNNLFGPARSLVNLNEQIQRSFVSLRRLHELFTLPVTKGNGKYISKISSISFSRVNFRYHEDSTAPALQDFSLEIPPGCRLGIVGGSGGGKSTFIKLLLNLYQPESGFININDVPMMEYCPSSLRRKIAYVEQEPKLFNDTIRYNIAFGVDEEKKTRLSVNDLDKLVQEATVSAKADFVHDLPQGLDTDIDRLGSTLSVGQKQRIALARALIRQPDVLILDEATANLDAISENLILETISILPREMIVIIISHRLNFIRNTDKIIVLEQGQIVEEGRPDELLGRKDGRYLAYFNTFNQKPSD